MVEVLELVAAKYELTVDELLSGLESGKLQLMTCRAYSIQLTSKTYWDFMQQGVRFPFAKINIYAVSANHAFQQFCEKQQFPFTRDMVSISISEV